MSKYTNSSHRMEVVKRDGSYQKVDFNKITKRIESLCNGLDKDYVDPSEVAQVTIGSIYNHISTEEIDFLSADICASRTQIHPDFNKLAARLCISNLHKITSSDFIQVIEQLYDNKDRMGNNSPLISKDVYNIVMENGNKINSVLDYSRDYMFDFFGIKTLERSYLLRLKNISSNSTMGSNKERKLASKYGKIIERPQHLIMRVALGIHKENLDKVFETYNLISQGYFTHATPTLYNSGTTREQDSSCFLFGMEDSLKGIYKCISDIALVSKWAGGIGVHVSNIRGNNSLIRGTNGNSDGIIPLCKVLNETAKYVNQGGKRNGSIAVYLEPWHADIWEFVELRRREGDEGRRARDLFLALWIPDIFMKRVKNDGTWSLMCPDECPRLTDTYGDEFEELYNKYEKEGKYRKQLKARDLWNHILISQIETGMPYICYKDNVNKKSNQANVGIIRSSNLCTEIMEYSDHNEYAVCNLVSLCLPKYLIKTDEGYTYDFNKLYEVTRVATYNLNKVIDVNFYPVKETERSNKRHRPIGIGVQGLVDVYNKMGFPYESKEASELNKKIFETIYFASLTESNELAKIEGHYKTFKGSPFSEGKLQYHLWGLTEADLLMDWDWNTLIDSIKKYGTRNSLLTSIMPTASTSQIMGNVECIEPYTSNIFVRTTIAGEYIVVNKNLINDLLKLGLWTEDVRNELMYFNGSVQKMKEIPQKLKDIYKTAGEIDQVHLVQQSVERGPFIDQSQSLNIFMDKPNRKRLTSSHFYGWSKGIKTAMYYLRSQPAVDPISFGLDHSIISKIKDKYSIGKLGDHNTNIESHESTDPRRINEIEEHNKQPTKPKLCKLRRKGIPYEDCEACGS